MGSRASGVEIAAKIAISQPPQPIQAADLLSCNGRWRTKSSTASQRLTFAVRLIPA
jgi:hypothetical protein